MPTTFLCGMPEAFCSAQTIASSGLVMQMTKAFGAYFLMPAPTWSILEIDAEQVVTTHAGLARHPGGHDAHVGVLDAFIGVGAAVLGVEALDRRRFRDIERFALRNAFHDVEHRNVAELFQ